MMKFYLLDDDRNIRRILTQIITDRELGTVCGAGSNGHEGLEEVFDLKPDIIIADLLMPEMDGITFVEHARPGLPDTAFIMLSQVSSKEMISAAYEAGVEFFIQKPINSIEVENVIQKVRQNLTMKRTLQKVQELFTEDIPGTLPEESETPSPPMMGMRRSPLTRNLWQRSRSSCRGWGSAAISAAGTLPPWWNT